MSVVIIIIFTSVILALMYNVKYENTRQLYKLSANVYLIETLEKIGIANYEDVTTNNVNLLPSDLPEIFQETIAVENLNNNQEYNFEEDVIKKVTVKISYIVNGKTYEQSISRLKQKK